MATDVTLSPPPLAGGCGGQGVAQAPLAPASPHPPNPLPQGEGELRGIPLLLAALPLIWPALFNGYPLVFADTGTYLSQAIHHYVGWDRPLFYSLALLPLHLTLTTWPVIVAQALLTTFILDQLRRALLPCSSPWLCPPLTIGLSVFTALPWFVSQLMPDLFTGLLVLTLGLLAFVPDTVSRTERRTLLALTIFMIAVHQSHLLLAVGLLPFLLLFTRSWPTTRRLILPPTLAALALITINLAAHHRAAISPFGNVFLLTRIIYDGPGQRVLQRDCPHIHWLLCAYADQLPPTADMFLWRPDGPVARAGGAKRVSAEADAIITAALQAEPGTELRALLGNAGEQITRFATGDGLTAWPDTVTPWIQRDFPAWEAAAYAAARQTHDALTLPAWLLALHWWTAILSLAVCLATLPLAGLRHPIAAGFLATVLLALPMNALITGGLSGPHDRYQSRVMWLPPLLAALALPALTPQALTRRRAI